MNAVFKYPFILGPGWTSLLLPVGARILHVEMQGNIPNVWALVDPRESLRAQKSILMVGTGFKHPDLTDSIQHLSTVKDGPFVWHFFHYPS